MTSTHIYSLYLVPGYVSPITRICLGGKNLLLIYADQCARLWDSQTKEFWRSMDRDKAEEMLMQDGWTTMYVVAIADYFFADTAGEGFYTKVVILPIRCGLLYRTHTMGWIQVRS